MLFMRSLMFVPGHRQKMIDKALGLAADVLLLDIEDGVVPAEKDTARQLISESLERVANDPEPADGRRPLRFVRINAIGHERMYADLEAVLRPGLDGLCLPKVETADEVRLVEQIVNEREERLGLTPGSIRFVVAIESALGLLNAYQIATSSSRMEAIMFGAEDFANDIGLPTKRVAEASEMLYARSALIMAAAAARINSVDGVYIDFKDSEGLLRDSLQARRLGFTGKSLIHPAQIEIINDVFRPDTGEVDYARRVVEAFEEAQARGDGAIALGGQLVDLPIVHRARRTLEVAEQLGVSSLSTEEETSTS